MLREVKSATKVLIKYNGDYFKLIHQTICGSDLYYGTESNPDSLRESHPDKLTGVPDMHDMVKLFASLEGYTTTMLDIQVEDVISLFYRILAIYPFAHFCLMKRRDAWSINVTSHLKQDKPHTPEYTNFCDVLSSDLSEALEVADNVLACELHSLARGS